MGKRNKLKRRVEALSNRNASLSKQIQEIQNDYDNLRKEHEALLGSRAEPVEEPCLSHRMPAGNEVNAPAAHDTTQDKVSMLSEESGIFKQERTSPASSVEEVPTPTGTNKELAHSKADQTKENVERDTDYWFLYAGPDEQPPESLEAPFLRPSEEESQSASAADNTGNQPSITYPGEQPPEYEPPSPYPNEGSSPTSPADDTYIQPSTTESPEPPPDTSVALSQLRDLGVPSESLEYYLSRAHNNVNDAANLCFDDQMNPHEFLYRAEVPTQWWLHLLEQTHEHPHAAVVLWRNSRENVEELKATNRTDEVWGLLQRVEFEIGRARRRMERETREEREERQRMSPDIGTTGIEDEQGGEDDHNEGYDEGQDDAYD